MYLPRIESFNNIHYLYTLLLNTKLLNYSNELCKYFNCIFCYISWKKSIIVFIIIKGDQMKGEVQINSRLCSQRKIQNREHCKKYSLPLNRW